jgi:hypothetical protein
MISATCPPLILDNSTLKLLARPYSALPLGAVGGCRTTAFGQPSVSFLTVHHLDSPPRFEEGFSKGNPYVSLLTEIITPVDEMFPRLTLASTRVSA